MDLRAIRTLFQSESGLNHLTDTELDRIINNGILFLNDKIYDIGTTPPDLLEVSSDSNWWTENRPLLVIKAAQFIYEGGNRNSEALKDWINAIEIEVTEVINTDIVSTLATSSVMGDGIYETTS